jgi:hypothetical protein
MSSRVILGLVAAMLVGAVLVPGAALAHRRIHLHIYKAPGLRVCSEASHRGWNAFSRNPGQAGFPGPHYGCDCYRAASGRAMCQII